MTASDNFRGSNKARSVNQPELSGCKDELVVVRLSEIKCLMCGRTAGYLVEGKLGSQSLKVFYSQNGQSSSRCQICGGGLYLDPLAEDPRELQINLSSLIPKEEPKESDVLEKRCVGCGKQVQRAKRCRNCYLRHRYATNPAVRAKQLALQSRWRKHQS